MVLNREFLRRKDFIKLFGEHKKFCWHEPEGLSYLPNNYKIFREKTIDVYSKQQMREILSAYLKIPIWKIDSIAFTFEDNYTKWGQPNALLTLEVRWVDRKPTWYERVFKGYK